jgi:hypothetical protein
LTKRKPRHTFVDMAIAKSRITEKRRTYEGEEAAESLVNWLNHTQDDEAKERIKRVVALFFDLWTHHAGMKRPKYTRTGHEQSREHQTSETKKRDELQKSLDEALSYYQTTPSVYVARVFGKPGDHKGFRVLLSSRPVVGSALARNLEQSGKSNDVLASLKNPNPTERDLMRGARMGETGAIRYVLELIQSGYIFKVHRCRCEMFFFQRFAHQRFCSEKCRITEFRTSDEARQKRNSYARKLYQLHKTKNLK